LHKEALVTDIITAANGERPPSTDPRDEARIRQIALSIPTNIDIGQLGAVAPHLDDPIIVDYGRGEPQVCMPDDLIRIWRGVISGFDATWHELTDLQVIVAGNTASVTSKIDRRHWIDARVFRSIGRYELRVVRRDGSWRVSHLGIVSTEESGDPGLAAEAHARAAALARAHSS
jgi:ketosteroid isomerase-like protein